MAVVQGRHEWLNHLHRSLSTAARYRLGITGFRSWRALSSRWDRCGQTCRRISRAHAQPLLVCLRYLEVRRRSISPAIGSSEPAGAHFSQRQRAWLPRLDKTGHPVALTMGSTRSRHPRRLVSVGRSRWVALGWSPGTTRMRPPGYGRLGEG